MRYVEAVLVYVALMVGLSLAIHLGHAIYNGHHRAKNWRWYPTVAMDTAGRIIAGVAVTAFAIFVAIVFLNEMLFKPLS